MVKGETETNLWTTDNVHFPNFAPTCCHALDPENQEDYKHRTILNNKYITLGAKLTHLGWSQSDDQLIKSRLSHRQILVCNVNHRQMPQSQPTRLLSQMSQLCQKFQLKQ